MRKLNKGRKLSMKKGPRIALLKSLAESLLLHEKIKTTEARAKELRPLVEKMITRAKYNKISNRRLLAKVLSQKIMKKLVEELAPKYADRNGGYIRIIHLGPRPSDGAKMVIIELVK